MSEEAYKLTEKKKRPDPRCLYFLRLPINYSINSTNVERWGEDHERRNKKFFR